MLNLLTKLIFYFRKPRFIIVTGKERCLTGKAIFQVLRKYFKVAIIEKIGPSNILKNEILILISDLKEDLSFFVKKSEKPILVVTHVGEIPPDIYWFAGEKRDIKKISEQTQRLPAHASLILNFDDETVREIGDKSQAFCLTFGFQKKAKVRASDFHINKVSTNFKINYQGNIVPVWLGNPLGKANVYAALAATCCGTQLGLNLIEISQALKSFQDSTGK